jgi:hypothetical protein
VDGPLRSYLALMRRTIFSLFLALALFGIAPTPAHAATGVKLDPVDGQNPDITKLRVINGSDALILKLFYVSLPEGGSMGGEEVHFGRGADFAHYAVSTTWNHLLGKWVTTLNRVTATQEFQELPCEGLTRFRDADAETSRHSIPRTCFPNAADTLKFWALACGPGCDDVAATRFIARG